MPYELKASRLTSNNTDALDIVREQLLTQPGVRHIYIGKTIAEFITDEENQAAEAVWAVIAKIPGRGHPRASLHAVARKLAVADAVRVVQHSTGWTPVICGDGEPELTLQELLTF